MWQSRLSISKRTLFVRLLLIVGGLCLHGGGASMGLVIELNDIGSTPLTATQLGGFERAASYWEVAFDDVVTLRLDVSFDALSPGVLGGTLTPRFVQTYSEVKAALIGDVTTAEDALGVLYLPEGPLAFRTVNRRSFKPYFDDNNTVNNNQLDLSRANAKALGLTINLGGDPGLLGPHDVSFPDADIVFSTNFSFDFEPDDGILSNHFDFVGVAVHEIGHALGFISGVDKLNGFSYDNFPVLSALDLFRYSAESLAIVGSDGLDIFLGGEPYFSIDGGATNLGLFSTGRGRTGDNNQASHWKDDLGLGIMDPTFTYQEIGVITDLDLLAFDMMGWDLAPEGLLGDLDLDGDVDGDDVGLMSLAINVGDASAVYDLDGSGVVDGADGLFLVEDVIGSNRADFNLDLQVDVADLSIWATGFASGSLFAEGDSNFDGQVDVADLSNWATGFGFVSSSALLGAGALELEGVSYALAIPEPGVGVWMLLMFGVMRRKYG